MLLAEHRNVKDNHAVAEENDGFIIEHVPLSSSMIGIYRYHVGNILVQA